MVERDRPDVHEGGESLPSVSRRIVRQLQRPPAMNAWQAIRLVRYANQYLAQMTTVRISLI